MSNQGLNFKAVSGQIAIDEAKGIIECFVAVIGNKDSVGDVILPGAFNKSLKRRKPRVVWGHDWNSPIGKVLEIFEMPPSDPRLPLKVKALGLGAVYARVQFNLKSERGREAFADVSFFGEEQEWSIGYKTLDAIYDPKMQANLLRELELYEVSPVLHGANQLTSTLSIKADGAFTPEDDDITSFRKSKWDTFDPAWAKWLKENHPEIWKLGGNVRGNSQYAALSGISENGGGAKSQADVNALNLREAWIARHRGDFRIAGVVAQIKWLAVGSRGEDYMKNLVKEEIKKRAEKSDPADLEVKAEGDKCPIATQDIAVNIKNRQKAIDDGGYGPLNPNEPNNKFWAAKAKRWDVTVDDAQKQRCGNCAAFIRTPKMLDCIDKGLGNEEGNDAWDVIGTAKLGYCEAFDFKCASSRTCDAWIVGGPITKEKGKPSEKSDTLQGMSDPYKKELALALVMEVGASVRIREYDKNMVIYDLLGTDGDVTTYRASYHFDGDQFMFGDPEEVEAETVYHAEDGPSLAIGEDDNEETWGETQVKGDTCECGEDAMPDANGICQECGLPMEPQAKSDDTDDDVEEKASPGAGKINDIVSAMGDRLPNPSNAIPDTLPQERVTGDILHGHGPRRGNLERLLRYWRPIMKKPGGFRRCRVILADHPELYPLDNICAWLHHETTGLWPNEGCHHPGMKNCRKKLKKGGKVVNGSLWSDSDFLEHHLPGKSAEDVWPENNGTDGDWWDNEEPTKEEVKDFALAMKQFMDDEPDFIDYLRNSDNWEHGGEDDNDEWTPHPWLIPAGSKPDGGCGCGCGKSDENDTEEKAGRTLSHKNRGRLMNASELIKQVLMDGDIAFKGADLVELQVDDSAQLVAHLTPVLANHHLSIELIGDTVSIKSDNMDFSAIDALASSLATYSEWDEVDDLDEKGLPRIGRRAQAMDPNAVDADGDGMVQDGTAFQRPAMRKPKLKLRERRAVARAEGDKVRNSWQARNAHPEDVAKRAATAQKLKKTELRKIEKLSPERQVDKFFADPAHAKEQLIDKPYGKERFDTSEGGVDMHVIDPHKVGRGDIIRISDGSGGIVLDVSDPAQDAQDMASEGKDPDFPSNKVTYWQTHGKGGKPLRADQQEVITEDAHDIGTWSEFMDARFDGLADDIEDITGPLDTARRFREMHFGMDRRAREAAAAKKKKSDIAEGLSLKIHTDWIAPVVKYHAIPIAVKGDQVFYDTDYLSTEAYTALTRAFEAATNEVKDI